MRVMLVLGTRPEIVKLGPVAQELDRRGVEYRIVHTGQHFDEAMSEWFLTAFDLHVDTQLEFGGLPRGAQIGQMTNALSEILGREPVDAVIVQGDTNSALAGALAANANLKRVLHVEAGLRSFDRRMPEEHNRVLIDSIADLCAAPTELAAANLHSMGVDSSRIRVTGNTVMDAIATIRAGHGEVAGAEQFDLTPRQYVLATIHRPENTDDPDRLEIILRALADAPLPVLLPLHPRTRAAIQRCGLDAARDLDGLHCIEPIDYRQFLALLESCAFAVSDSGGVQEEVTAFGVPLIVARDSTERPEVIGTFADHVSGADGDGLRSAIERLGRSHAQRRAELADTPSPFAAPDGRSPAAHIAELLLA